MKLLWANSSFLHPTTRGGQIRTLEMLRQLHRRHEIHYAALANPDEPEGVRRAAEYSANAIPFEFRPVSKRSARFALELAAGAVSTLPLAISRWRCAEMRQALTALIKKESYDAMVCDFLVTAINFPALETAALFQHNVENVIWKRHAENATGLKRRYFQLQADRMFAFEAAACKRAGRVIAVSEQDAATMEQQFGVRCPAVPTGVNTDYFRPPEPPKQKTGLVFVGSMDWMPNIDGIHWFSSEILPRIRAARKDLPVTIVGRTPPPSIAALARGDPYFRVTGTVPDVRPYLWEAALSIVPLRIGGGTRLKIYESMAAGCPVVSTAIGAEGLDATHGETIAIADAPEDFARLCLELAADAQARNKMAAMAMEMVASRYSWDQVARRFEQILFV
jgi:polysaccharide biosynthesis protein PslH